MMDEGLQDSHGIDQQGGGWGSTGVVLEQDVQQQLGDGLHDIRATVQKGGNSSSLKMMPIP